jgi:tetratricopeptide (TPR) repeat protein
MKKLLIILLIFVPFTAAADTLTAARYILIDSFPEAAASGEASSAMFTGISFMDINPASIAAISGPEYSVMHNIWLQGITNQKVAIGKNFDFGTAAAAFSYVDMGVVEKIAMDEFGAPLPSSDIAELYAFSFSGVAAKKIKNLLLGVGAEFINQSIDSDRQGYMSFSAGAIQRSVFVNNLDVGFSVLNFSFDADHLTMPLVIKGGIGYTAKEGGEEILKAGAGVSYMADSDRTNIEAGAQYALFTGLLLRAGVDADTKDGARLSTGFGIRLDDFNINYSYQPSGELGDVHKFSIKGSIGGAAEIKINDEGFEDKGEEEGTGSEGNIGWGDYYYRKKQFSKALRYYEKANLLEWKKIDSMNDREKSAFYQKLGICYYNIRDNARARQYFDKAYFYEKDNEILKHWIKLMKESAE